jgi:hypothetical protein
MKSTYFLYRTAFLFLLTGCFVLQACKKPSAGVEVTVNTDLYTSPMLFRFVNANNTGTSQPGNFDIKVTGKDAALVITPEGQRTFKTRGGFLTLMLQKSAAPSTGHPVQFSLTANVDGFTPVVQNITIVADSTYRQDINLVEYAKPAEGTSALVKQTTLTAGVATATVLTMPATAVTEPAKINITAGTKFLAADGSQITAGNLESKIVYYSTVAAASLKAFPGGFQPNNIVGENGQPIPGGATFITAGAVAANMKVGNTVVKSFSQPLQVTMPVSSTLVNPNTGTAVKAGDIVPVWSVDENSGQRKFEVNGTVTDDNGKLVIRFAMEHLSYWYADWCFYKGAANTCDRNMDAPFTVSVSSPVSAFYGRIYLATAAGQLLADYPGSYATIYDQGLYRFYGNLPNTTGVKVIVTNQSGVQLAESEVFNPCPTSQASVTIPAAAFPPVSPVTMHLNARCSNKDIVANVSANANVYILEGSNYVYFTSVYVMNSVSEFIIYNNRTYKVEAYYGSKMYSAAIEFKSADFNFAGTVPGASLKGKAVYDKTGNSYMVTSDIAITCN